MPYQNTQK